MSRHFRGGCGPGRSTATMRWTTTSPRSRGTSWRSSTSSRPGSSRSGVLLWLHLWHFHCHCHCMSSYLFNIACQARKCHGQLQKTLLELEDEINKKCNSIYIDEVKCSTLRKSISINCYWGYWIETMGWVLDLDMNMDMIKYRNES